jgi:hypothetical protein
MQCLAAIHVSSMKCPAEFSGIMQQMRQVRMTTVGWFEDDPHFGARSAKQT